MSDKSSYRQILRSSAVMGGAQAINYMVGLLRIKVVAVLLGPAGVGVIGLYTSASNLVGAVTGLGLQRSAVRAIASADGDPVAVARATRMLRRLCWATGVLGWVASVALAIPLSRLMFQSSTHAWALAILGGTLLLGAINGGQLALLRGLRRIDDIARVQVVGAVLNTIVTVALYAWLRERGIVPVMLATASVSLAISWWFVRKVEFPAMSMSWGEAVAEAKPMVSLGIALMISTVLSMVLEFYTRSLVSRTYGVDAVGIYQAAWSLSGMFAGFVLTAMGTDFYPRLTAVIDDRVAAIREINEQTEIGVLLALPGLLVTLALAKWIVWALYSSAFAPATNVLVWMSLGVFGRVVSWPMGYVQLALNTGKWYAATEFFFIALQAALVTWMVPRFGVLGAAYAFFACYVSYFIGMSLITRRLIGFRHSPAALRLIVIATLLMMVTMAAGQLLPDLPGAILACTFAFAGGLWCLRGLSHRLGNDHRLIRVITRIPGIELVLPKRKPR
jgi:PST family polysaccharide transporter